MLDKKSKQVLKALNKFHSKNPNLGASKDLLPYVPNFDLKSLDQTLEYLHDLGYIKCTYGDCTVWQIKLNYEGLNYNEFNWIKTKDMLYKSIIIPIFVSIATSGIIYLLSTYCFK